MKLTTKKKGFTIVELVIVIAVIAILAAVLIPTFINLINQANQSNDMVLVTEINKAILLYETTNANADIDVNLAMTIAEEQGFNVTKMSPLSDGNIIIWDDVNNRFALATPDETGKIIEWLEWDEAKGHVDADSTDIWVFSSDVNVVKYEKYHYMLPIKMDDIEDSAEFWNGLNGSQVVLYEDWTKDIVIPTGATAAINLNNKTVTNKGTDTNTITVESGATLELVGNGSIASNQNGKSVIWVEENATLKINGATIVREKNNGTASDWYTVVNFGTMTIGADTTIIVPAEVSSSASLIVNGLASTGTEGTLIIEGGTFEGAGSGIVKNECGTVTIKDGTFINNFKATSYSDSDRQVLQNNDKMIIKGGKFIANNDTNIVWMSAENAELKVDGGEFSATGNNQYIFLGEKNSNITVTNGTFLKGFLCYSSSDVVPTLVRATSKGIRLTSGNIAEGSVQICTNDLDGNWGDIICPESELGNYDVAAWRDDVYFLYADKALGVNAMDNTLVYFYKSPTQTLDVKTNYSYEFVFYLAEGVDTGKMNFLPPNASYQVILTETTSDNPAFAKKLTINASAAQEGAVASIDRNGTTLYYATLPNAISASIDGETVKVLTNTELASNATVYKNITIDLNNCTVVGSKYIQASESTVKIKNGKINFELRGKNGALLELDNVDFSDATIYTGTTLNCDASAVINTRYYTSIDNGNGTWTVDYKEGYYNTTRMDDGYIEILDNGVYSAVKVESVADLEAYRGKIVNSRLTFDLDGYQSEGYVIKYTSSKYVATYVGDSTLSSGTYSTNVSDYLASNYMMYLSSGKYVVTSITSIKITTTYAGKICGGIFTQAQYDLNTAGALADGYAWELQADGTYKVVPTT